MRVLVTGSAGFIGRHVCEALARRGDEIIPFTEDHDADDLKRGCFEADAIVHLAGVNRPKDVAEFDKGNRGLTQEIVDLLEKIEKPVGVVFASSTQAELDNPYGASKLEAENALRGLAESRGNPVVVFRFSNVFGKWVRPNYNSAIATFCHNIARDLPIEVSDPARSLRLLYIDDAVASILRALDELSQHPGFRRLEAEPTREVTLGQIVETLQGFRRHREDLMLPDLSDPFIRKLYATYVSYLEGEMREYGLQIRTDARGSLAEFVKSPHFGQIFVSRTKPGITRGNHYHHSKVEKFLVLEGEALIRFRHIERDEVETHHVKGEDYRVVDITPGWTHSIENVGPGELVTLFWANELFDPDKPDTYFQEVLPQ